MFTEEIKYDVTVKSAGHLEVLRVTLVLRDGVEIARTNHRHVITPGDDVTNEIGLVQTLSGLWTEEQIEQARITNES